MNCRSVSIFSAILFIAGASLPFNALAQGDPPAMCPTGLQELFHYVVRSGLNPGDDIKQDVYTDFTLDSLDDTYKQQSIVPASQMGNWFTANSNLSASDIPGGFWVSVWGFSNDGHRWALMLPYDGNSILQDMGNGVTRFELGNYADSGSTSPGGGAIFVTVCCKCTFH